ncbi:MAG: hypothetical protein JST92_17420 [Deltaproteobacteria bacterium]|nr:hypothetical protein [Deltaproteobacteria bacterium]
MSWRVPAQYEAAIALEQALGDPRSAASAISFQSAVQLDEREDFPQPHVDALVRWGYLRNMVPQASGGLLSTFEGAAALQRAVARRDLTAAIALGQSFPGSVAE